MTAHRRTYHIWTIGCQMNQADSRYLSSQLETLGYTPTDNASRADLIILNTCVVRQQAEDKAYDRLRILKGLKTRQPGKTIAVMGCLVGRKSAASLLERFPFVDVFMPPSDTGPLLEHLEQNGSASTGRVHDVRTRTTREMLQNGDGVMPESERGRAVTAFVPVVLGCSYACSYCVIPSRRGAERSRPREEILEEVRKLADHGVREVTVLGQIVDRYGMDLNGSSDLADLLTRVAGIDGIRRVRFLTSHPNWLSDRLLDTIASTPGVCPLIEVPFQSGNDEILERMKRGYTADDYRRLVDRIRARTPDAAIHTDIIVGFPGETEEQFMDSFHLLSELELDMAHIAKYSERPLTLAAEKYTDDVPADVKEQRRTLLEEVLADILEKKNRRLLGKEVEVLAEDQGRNKRWRGRTVHGKLVFFEDDRDRLGQLVNVRVEWTAPFTLRGKAVDNEPSLTSERQEAETHGHD